MPGLIDMHAHHHRDHEGVLPKKNWESAIYLAYGVTTTLDNSMWSGHVFPQGELIESGMVLGPRTFSTGDPLYSRRRRAPERDHQLPRSREQNIARLQAWGAITLKQYGQPRRDQRQWISDIARKRGLRVTAEGGDLEYNLGMIMDGHTGWEHPLPYMPLYGDAAQFFGQAKARLLGDVPGRRPGPWNEEYFFQDSDVWRDEKLRRFTPWRMLIPARAAACCGPSPTTASRSSPAGSATSSRTAATARSDRTASSTAWDRTGRRGRPRPAWATWTRWRSRRIHGAQFLGLERRAGLARDRQSGGPAGAQRESARRHS